MLEGEESLPMELLRNGWVAGLAQYFPTFLMAAKFYTFMCVKALYNPSCVATLDH